MGLVMGLGVGRMELVGNEFDLCFTWLWVGRNSGFSLLTDCV
jgi:hypothetical protein